MLKNYLGEQKEVIVEAGNTVRETLTKLGINPDLVAGVFINEEQQAKDYIIQDGDVVKVMAVIGGGGSTCPGYKKGSQDQQAYPVNGHFSCFRFFHFVPLLEIEQLAQHT